MPVGTAPRRGRLTIPRVNPNPRPPNEPKPRNQQNNAGANNGGRPQTGNQGNSGQGGQNGNQGGSQGAGGGGQGAGGGGQGGGGRNSAIKGLVRKLTKVENRVPNPPVSPAAPVRPLNAQNTQQQILALGNNPANALAFSSFQPGPGQVDPRDSEYWGNVTNLLFNTQSDIQGLNLDQSREDIDYASGIADMRTNRERSQRSLAEAAMRKGLTNSGWLDVNDAEDTQDYLRDYEDYSMQHTRNTADRQSGISAAIQSFIADEMGLAQSAADRYSTLQLDRSSDEAPLYSPADIQRLERLLRGGRRNGGSGGNGNGRGNNGSGRGNGGGGSNRGGGGNRGNGNRRGRK